MLAWEPRLNEWPSTGNRCTDQPCLDLDVRHPEAAEACEQKVRDWSDGRGELLVRFGLAPKRLIPFRTDTPFKKRLLVYRAPNGDRHRIELLADGQQAIFYGYHVEAKQDYRWHADRDPLKVPPREWPSITELEADELLAALDELLIEQFGYERINPEKPNGHAPSAIHVRDVDAALAALDYRGVGGGGNMHDTALGCINALIVQGNPTTHAVEEVGATIGVYAAGNPLCARWSPEKVRRILEGMAFSFINKFPDFADRLPPELYAARQVRRGQGVLEPKLEYDRLHRCWHYPEPPAGNGTDKGPASAPAAEQKFRLVPFGQLRPGNEPGYLVDELIPLRGIVLIWGKRKCLKSFWTYDLSFHIARYPEYRERSILQGAVVYCAFEGAHGYKKRAEALRRYHKVPADEEVSLYLVPGRANMIKEYPLLISAVREQLAGEVPRMVVLDTLNKSLVGSESKDVDMAAYIVAAEALRDAFDCVVVIIHHCGYDETHPRGHTSLTGAVDAEFEVMREGMLVTVKNVTMRDGPEGFEIRSQAELVEVGEDVRGKVLTSLVIAPTDAPATAGQKRGRGRRDVTTPIFIDAMRAALAERGAPFRPPGARATEHVVNESEVRARFEVGYPAGESDKVKAADNTRKAYQRALHNAVAENVIGKGVRAGDDVLWFKAPTA